MTALLALGVFLFTALEEKVAVRRAWAIVGKQPMQAGFWSAALALMIVCTIAPVLKDWRMAIPYVLGSGLGSWYTVHKGR